MRKDMHKVLVEEPRHGGGPGKKHRRDNLPDDLLPKFEGIKRPHRNRKWFGEHLGPLKRWLRSNVGRPWNHVYSEACAIIKGGNPVRAHIRFHMMDMIERHTFMRDGEVWCYQRRGARPVSSLGGYSLSPTFYVHPATGILLEAQGETRASWFSTLASDLGIQFTAPQNVKRWMDPATALRKLNGCWFACRVKPFPGQHEKEQQRYDYAERKYLTLANAEAIYGKPVLCIQKRQLSSKELRRLGLKNDPLYLSASDPAESASVGANSAGPNKILGHASSLPVFPGTVLRVGWSERD